mgnify:FL=1
MVSSLGKKSLELKRYKKDDPIADRQVFIYNQTASRIYNFMIKYIQFFSTHLDIEFI